MPYPGMLWCSLKGFLMLMTLLQISGGAVLSLLSSLGKAVFMSQFPGEIRVGVRIFEHPKLP